MDYKSFRSEVRTLFPGVTGGFGMLKPNPDETESYFLAREKEGYYISFDLNVRPRNPWGYGQKQSNGVMVHGQGKTLAEALANYKSQVNH